MQSNKKIMLKIILGVFLLSNNIDASQRGRGGKSEQKQKDVTQASQQPEPTNFKKQATKNVEKKTVPKKDLWTPGRVERTYIRNGDHGTHHVTHAYGAEEQINNGGKFNYHVTTPSKTRLDYKHRPGKEPKSIPAPSHAQNPTETNQRVVDYANTFSKSFSLAVDEKRLGK